MSALLKDVRFAARMLVKAPVLTAAAVCSLALGIGANTAIFSVVDTVLLRPLPYEEPGRLVVLRETGLKSPEPFEVSWPNFLEWRAQSRSFETMAAAIPAVVVLGGRAGTSGGAEEPERRDAALVTESMFAVLRAQPAIGRGFSPDEDRPGARSVVVVSDRLWRGRFGSDPSLVGRSIVLNGRPRNVVGIMPASVAFPSEETDFWLPLGTHAEEMQNRAVHLLLVVGRLAPGRTIEDARAETAALAELVQRRSPSEDPGHGAALLSLRTWIVGGVEPGLLALFGAVTFVLLIACANVAHLLLARAAARRREFAVRRALGAGPGIIVRQLLVESILLALAGGGVGMLGALWGIDLLRSSLTSFLPRAEGIALDPHVLAFTLALSVLTGVAFGLVPAVHAARRDPHTVLRGSTIEAGSGRVRARGLLVAGELALSLILLAGAGLMIRSLWRLGQVDPGFRPEKLMTMTVSLPEAKYRERQSTIDFYRALQTRLESLPGVEAASAVSALPISGGDAHGELTIEGRPFAPGEAPAASFRRVLGGYFRTLHIPLVRGREFDDHDGGPVRPRGTGSPGVPGRQDGEAERVVIINETMARRFWPGGDPIGTRIKVGPAENEPWLTIVGVVGDVRNVALDEEPELATYEPHAQRPWTTMTLFVRTASDPKALAEPVRRLVRQAEPDAPIDAASSMDDRIADSLAVRHLSALLLRAFAAMALLLASVGIYGVMSYSVAARTREIGVRAALGAGRRDLLALVLAQGMKLAFIGVAAGLLASWALTRFLASLLYGVSPTDPATLGVASLLLVGVSFLACYLPARRATRVAPMDALRYE